LVRTPFTPQQIRQGDNENGKEVSLQIRFAFSGLIGFNYALMRP
jgi:hypothetical protein